jgi:hypothetical protein
LLTDAVDTAVAEVPKPDGGSLTLALSATVLK